MMIQPLTDKAGHVIGYFTHGTQTLRAFRQALETHYPGKVPKAAKAKHGFYVWTKCEPSEDLNHTDVALVPLTPRYYPKFGPHFRYESLLGTYIAIPQRKGKK